MFREDIIKAAIPLFAEYGVKSVSMDEIANALHISKKTLYQQFESKKELLLESFNYEIIRLKREIVNIEQNSLSALEKLQKINTCISKRIASLCPALYKEIRRYPELFELWNAYLKKLEQKCFFYLKKAVKEGDLVSRTDYEIIAVLYIEHLLGIKAGYKHTMTETLLRGLATDKGRIVLEQLNCETKINQ